MDTAIALVGGIVLVIGVAYFYNRWKTSRQPKPVAPKTPPDKPFPG